MLQNFATAIVYQLEKHHYYISDEERSIYLYGAEIALYSILSTLGLLAIGWLMNDIHNTCIIVSIYYTNQTLGGGFHASSHYRCFSMMAIGLFIALNIIHYVNIPSYLWTVIALLSLFLLFVLPLVLHTNKLYLSKKAKSIIFRSRIATSIQFILFFFFVRSPFFPSFCLGISIAALSRLAAAKTSHPY